MLYLDKLSFSQVTSVFRSFCNYYEKGRPGSLIRCHSKDVICPFYNLMCMFYFFLIIILPQKLDSADNIVEFPMSCEDRLNIENPKKKINFDKDRQEIVI